MRKLRMMTPSDVPDNWTKWAKIGLFILLNATCFALIPPSLSPPLPLSLPPSPFPVCLSPSPFFAYYYYTYIYLSWDCCVESLFFQTSGFCCVEHVGNKKRFKKKGGGNWRQKIRGGGRLATNATTLDRGEGKSSGPKPDHIKCCCVEFVGGIGWRQTIFFKYRGGGLVAIEMGPATDRGGGISGHLKWSGGR
jgi:hypothetical protein